MEELQEKRSSLLASEVHVRTIRFDCEPALIAAFETLLSNDELARATRLRFDHLQTGFITAHGALRILLGRYLGIAPATLAFRSDENGKPSLVDHTRLRFNISHSGRLVVFAFASDCEVGIDAEEIRPVSDLSSIATNFFSPSEASDLLSLPKATAGHAQTRNLQPILGSPFQRLSIARSGFDGRLKRIRPDRQSHERSHKSDEHRQQTASW